MIPAGNYMLKVNNRNTRTSCEICLNLTIKTPERCHWRFTSQILKMWIHKNINIQISWERNIIFSSNEKIHSLYI